MSDTHGGASRSVPLWHLQEGFDRRATACFRTELVVPEDTAKWQVQRVCKHGSLSEMQLSRNHFRLSSIHQSGPASRRMRIVPYRSRVLGPEPSRVTSVTPSLVAGCHAGRNGGEHVRHLGEEVCRRAFPCGFPGRVRSACHRVFSYGTCRSRRHRAMAGSSRLQTRISLGDVTFEEPLSSK
jgi:hypothetical protein